MTTYEYAQAAHEQDGCAYGEWLAWMDNERLASTNTRALLMMLSDLEREIHARNNKPEIVQ